MPLAADTLDSLVERVAGREPAPGGGAAASFACALAAGLVEMAARFSLPAEAEAEADAGAEGAGADGHERVRELRDRVRGLRFEALALADRDAAGYGRVIEAYGLPRKDPQRGDAIRSALSAAADPPLALAAAAAETAELGAEIASSGNPNLRGDARTAALLGEAATRAACGLVRINLEGMPGDPRLGRSDEVLGRALAARERVLAD